MMERDNLNELTIRADRALARLIAAKEALDPSSSESSRTEALAEGLFNLISLRNEIGFAEARLIQAPHDPSHKQEIAALEERLVGLELETNSLCGK